MDIFVVHPKDPEQQRALQPFLESSHIPYEQEPEINATERIPANPVMAKRLDNSIQNIEHGNVTSVKPEDLWK